MKKLLSLFIVFIVLVSCKKDDEFINIEETIQGESITDEEFAQYNFGVAIEVNFIGKVVDESGNRLRDVQIAIGNKTVNTDHNGIFVLNSVSVHDKFVFVKASKDGYIKGFRSLVPTSEGSNDIQITLLKKNVIGTVTSGEASEVSMSNGSKVTFGGGFIDVSGNSYFGQVEVSMHYLEPNKATTFVQMPGMLFGQREDGSASSMETYGMLSVNLFSPSGEVLNISEDSPAKLSFPISTTTPNVETDIPLWYFDEATGYWKEQGSATKLANDYITLVTHFTWWNCDIPVSKIINGCINLTSDNTSKPLTNYYLEIFRKSNNQQIFGGYTNAEGKECGWFPKDEELSVKVYSDCKENILYESIEEFVVSDTIIDIVVLETTDITETELQATILDCSGNPLTKGYVYLFDDNFNDFFVEIINGVFNYNISGCTNANYNMIIYDLQSEKSSEITTLSLVSPITDLGVLSVCAIDIGGAFTGDITLETQEEVDLFGLLGYSEINGILTIEGSDDLSNIASLLALESLTSVTGDLNIYSNDSLKDLSGLENLTSVTGYLRISENASLLDVTHLRNLMLVESLIIVSNPSLTGLLGLENLSSVGETMYVENNDLLTSLEGLGNLILVGRDLRIWDNASLKDLTGLGKLASVGGYIEITLNSSLIDIIGLKNLTSVDGYLRVFKNDLLTDLEGLDNLTSLGGSLILGANDSLENITNLLNIASLGGDLNISENASLKKLTGLGNLTSVEGQCFIAQNNSLTDLTGLQGITSISEYLMIRQNQSLISLSGLESLNTIGGNIYIGSALFSNNIELGNPVLSNYCALTNLFMNGIYGDVNIVNNKYNPSVENIKTNNNCSQ
ncbi:MAG: hypothetical protein ABJL44_12895 [Algibacter sp.]